MGPLILRPTRKATAARQAVDQGVLPGCTFSIRPASNFGGSGDT